MDMKEFERSLPKIGEKVNASLLAEVELLREENEMLKEIIKIYEKRIGNFNSLFENIFEEPKKL